MSQIGLELSEEVVIILFKIAMEAKAFRWHYEVSQAARYTKWTVEELCSDFVASNGLRCELQARGSSRKGNA